MTDARALRETVARELANDMGEVVDRAWKFYLRGADAAIAIVLEEAARVVVENYQELCAEHRLLLLNRANAIRALKEKQ